MTNDINTALSHLRRRESPGNADMLKELSVGLEPLIDFYRKQYLSDYIAKGGSKIKFVTGRAGSGNTHFLQYLAAQEMGLIAVYFPPETCEFTISTKYMRRYSGKLT